MAEAMHPAPAALPFELDPAGLADIPDLIRCEDFDREALSEHITELTHTVYPHEQVYGPYITIHAHIACPPKLVFAYMADPYSLLESAPRARRPACPSTPSICW
jgi:hypothetical protein